MNDGLKLHDWNDARLILATAKLGSFVQAAKMLGMDQKTASRKIGALEQAIGLPLFHRRRSGAVPTKDGLVIIRYAEKIADAVADFEALLKGTASGVAPTVTVSATEGIQAYLLIPALLGGKELPHPLDNAWLPRPLAPLAFTPYGNPADITVVATNPEDLPVGRSAMHVRKIGRMRFMLVASHNFPLRDVSISSFDDIYAYPLIDMAMYKELSGLAPWNNIIAERECGPLLVATNTSSMQRPVAGGAGITIFPGYAPMFDDRLLTLDVPAPEMAVDLWLTAHEDVLRAPAVRLLYDGIADMFTHSPWFRM